MFKKILKTDDNIKIAINHYQTNHNQVIILAPGWFMTKDSSAFDSMAREFARDFDVISLDFRGHGCSSGFYTFTSKENFDLKAVVDYAKKSYLKVYLAGFSLGGALVLIHGAQFCNVDKIIAISAPDEFNKIENQFWRPEAFVPTFKKFELKRWLSVRPSLIIRKKVKPIDIVQNIKVPILFIAGKKDPTICFYHTKALYEKAVSQKKYELFENGIHAEDLYLDEPARFMSVCTNFLKGEG